MARLIDDGPEVVEFFPAVAGVDGYGQPVESVAAEPVVLRTMLHRVSSDEADGLDLGTRTAFRFTTGRVLVSGPGAKVYARGRRWSVVGEPMVQGRSPRTRHTTVTIVAEDGPHDG